MKITIDNAGKRFNFEWILQHVNLTFQSGKSYAILGPNGSGKSTLLQMIAGMIAPSSGSIKYSNEDVMLSPDEKIGINSVEASSAEHSHPSTPLRVTETLIDNEEIFRHLAFTAPYLELIEEFTAAEMISFQKEFKALQAGISETDVLKIAQLEKDISKQIRNFSSGMKQRLKVSLALLADVPVLLLDEPTTNLDQHGFEWYLDLIKKFSNNRLLIICSNLEREYSFCDERIDVTKFKT